MQKLTFTSTTTSEVISLTKIVNDLLMKNGFEKGLVNLFLTHTTCALAIVDSDNTQVDNSPETFTKNTAGYSLTIPVESATMVLGHRQKVALLEFAGPRERHVVLTFIPDSK